MTDALIAAWDRFENAAQRILVAQPYQMTEAASALEEARKAMRVQMIAELSKRTSP